VGAQAFVSAAEKSLRSDTIEFAGIHCSWNSSHFLKHPLRENPANIGPQVKLPVIFFAQKLNEMIRDDTIVQHLCLV